MLLGQIITSNQNKWPLLHQFLLLRWSLPLIYECFESRCCDSPHKCIRLSWCSTWKTCLLTGPELIFDRHRFMSLPAIYHIFFARSGSKSESNYRHSSIYAVNVRTQEKKTQKQKPCKSRLLSSTKGEENRLELWTAVNRKSWKSRNACTLFCS